MKWIVRSVVLLILLAGMAAGYALVQFTTPTYEDDKTIVIEKGLGARQILARLHAQGVIPAPWKIMPMAVASGSMASLKAGEYDLSGGMSPREVLAQIASGRVVVHSITIPEGWSVAQIRAALLADPLLTGEVPADIPEGSVLPETVHFSRGDSRASIIERLQRQMDEVLDAAWTARAEGLPFASKEEALVLASIVEAETGVSEERAKVAGVYINRLKQGMPLQADPTVAYGIAPGGMKRMLTTNDLKRDTAYNTYMHTGLPPGPICNPGRASIQAALRPAATTALYFVATGTGGHWFADTVKEHNANVARYRAVMRSR